MERFTSRSTSAKRVAAGLVFAVVGAAAGFPRPAVASHDTCSIIALVAGSEQGAEALSLAAINAVLPLVIRRDDVRLTVYDVRWLDITCVTSTFAFRVPVKIVYEPSPYLRVSRRGTARIDGHYAIVLGTPTTVCVDDLTLAGLNFRDVPKWVDDGVRSLINRSGALDSFCFPLS